MSVSAAPPDRPRHTLLVVDDQPINIRVLYQAFADDHRVLQAGSGAGAVQICREARPDLVLLDVVMPGMDGFEVCRQLKADPATRDIPIIFVTGHDDASQETLGLELGAVDFIVKPINPAVVRARVKTHLEFARSASLLAATLETSHDGILVTDLGGGISSLNQAFARMWKLPADLQPTLVGRDAVLALMRDQLCEPGLLGAARGPTTLELCDRRVISHSMSPLTINGSQRGQVWVFRDVTERRRAADELLRLNESLETRIQERTQALAEATQLAQAASQAKSDFLSNMSHEIRTPMNAVIGLALLALKADPNPKLRDYLEKIRLSGQHLMGIVNDILDFSKIEAGKLELDEIDFSLATVFEVISSQTADAARAKGLDLSFEIDASLSRALRGDPLRLGQVLLNYVGNAIKFTTQGEVRVRATTLQRGESDSLVRIEVQDTGIGLAEAQVAQLFQTFHQADTSTTRQHGGTGLGLAVCKQLATLMGGEVGVHSQPGQGSRFWFTCRLRFGTSGTAGAAAAMAPAGAGDPRQRLQGARILLVEDNLLNQEVAAGLLADAGVIVTVANHGQQALQQLQTARFDCVLMDLQMPVMDGLQATRAIRANPLFADLPVLAMTANARGEDRTHCLAAGMSDFLTKPVLPDQLFAAVARWLPPVPVPASAPAAAAPTPADGVPAGDPDIIDLSILSRQVGADTHKVRRYATLFVEAMPESMAELNTALDDGDLPTLADLGHRLKSSARMVGALGLAGLYELLEGLRHGGTVADARRIVDRIPPVLARISDDVATALT
jgi:signal transduction histidine kinase/HPt (histidine-containing phosphotransfer) domain-containing protein/BarA-like signal transduction histidine kinase